MDKLIDKRLSDEDLADLAAASSSLSQLPITICDSPNVTVQKIRAQARTIKNHELIIVDFMTLLQSTQRYDSRNLEVGAISRQLKILATELRIPIVVLCQLNRTQDETEEPGLMSLRDSGELEQNANKIVFLWKIDSDTGTIGVKVAKNRPRQNRHCSDGLRRLAHAVHRTDRGLHTSGQKSGGGEMKALDLDDVRRLLVHVHVRAGGAIGGLRGQGL